MSTLVTHPCWDIVNCEKRSRCIQGNNEEKVCWERVREDDAISFHICRDCLVYLARQKDSAISREKLEKILEKRRRKGLQKKWCQLSHTLIDSWYPFTTMSAERKQSA